MLIGVLSDTHMPRRSKSLPPLVWRGLEDVDLILHAGDINHPDLLHELGLIAPVHAVLGNTDPYELQIKLPLPTLWTNSYFVSTVGGASLEIIKQYIENQKKV